MKKLLLLCLGLSCLSHVLGQRRKTLQLSTVSEEITIDGILNETVWAASIKADQFWQQFPSDSARASSKTEVMVCSDDANIYIAAICYDSNPDKKYIVQSLKRDFLYEQSDCFRVYIDPFMDQTNGFAFAVSPFGVQAEAAVEFGGGFGVNDAWDNKWFSEVTILEDRWIVEIKIPFKTIRYDDERMSWGINFARTDLKINEISVWNKVPINFNPSALAFTGSLEWDKKPTPAGTNISFIPYVSVSSSKDFQNDQASFKPGIGFDAKIALSSSLNLDLTVNPDFSQVDVDAQVTNLSRFSIFFPEKRQFFIENSDLFGRYGFSQIRPFFSRKIGLDNNNQPLTILGGARLSGKLNQNWRIGLMNMQTEGGAGYNPENYTVAAIQRNVFKASNLAAIVVNRQGFLNDRFNGADYSRILGLDFNLQSGNGKHKGKLFSHLSLSPDKSDYSHASWYMYSVRNFTFHWNHEYVGKDYRADVGFVPRIQNFNSETGQYEYKSYWRIEPSFSYRFYPKNKKINTISPEVYLSEYYDENFKQTETWLGTGLNFNMVDQSKFGVRGVYRSTLLLFDTDITFSGNIPHSKGYYFYNHVYAFYESAPTKVFGYSVSANYGGYYSGEKLTYSGDISYRIQPKFKASLGFDQNNIWFDSLRNEVSFTLLSPKIEYQLNKKVFFTTFLQYNTQVENVNLNARFQYRFRPMSDLFIVYTDNYDSNIFGVKNRALVIKLVWWLNV
jgi:hypothetical protein